MFKNSLMFSSPLQARQIKIYETEGIFFLFDFNFNSLIAGWLVCLFLNHFRPVREENASVHQSDLPLAEVSLWMSVSLLQSWKPSCSITTTCRRSWPTTCSTWQKTWRTTVWQRRTSSNRTTRWLNGLTLHLIVLSPSGLLNVSVRFHSFSLFDSLFSNFLISISACFCCLSSVCPQVGSITQKKPLLHLMPFHYLSLLGRLWVSRCARRTWTLRSWRRSRSDWSSTPRSPSTGCCGSCWSSSPSPSSAWSSLSESSRGSDDDDGASLTLNS